MDKIKTNYFIDIVMVFLFLIVSLTGLVLFFFLPSGIKGGRYQTFLGIAKHDWSFIHNWFGIVLIFLMLIHILIHLKWIISMTKSFFKKN